MDGTVAGYNPLRYRFLRGTLRLRPATCTRVPAWELAFVLEGLSAAPFEPLDSVSEKFLTLETVFLLAISPLESRRPSGPICIPYVP